MMIMAKAGERVMDAKTGDVICVIRNDIRRHTPVVSGDFHLFTAGNRPWVPSERIDGRCTRQKENGGLQLFVEGEWR